MYVVHHQQKITNIDFEDSYSILFFLSKIDKIISRQLFLYQKLDILERNN